jgi:hypothetical protein
MLQKVSEHLLLSQSRDAGSRRTFEFAEILHFILPVEAIHRSVTRKPRPFSHDYHKDADVTTDLLACLGKAAVPPISGCTMPDALVAYIANCPTISSRVFTG